MKMTSLPPDAPPPRMCILEKDFPSQEYGYNLHAEKGKGQFVGTVDRGSVAMRSGLRTGDHIFAVNGEAIKHDNHKKVVERIKKDPMRCSLLVIEESAAEWYRQRHIDIRTDLPNIVYMTKEDGPPPPAPASSPPNSSPPPATWYAPQAGLSKPSPVFVAPPPPVEMRPRPRLCHLQKSAATDEFGFNLHAEKGRGHFIGTVDPGGIGDLAGLRMGQRIVGVNGELVYPGTPHKDVVAFIKRSPLQTTLLVASEDVDRWYKENDEQYSFTVVEDVHEERKDELSPHLSEEVVETIARRMTQEVIDSVYVEQKPSESQAPPPVVAYAPPIAPVAPPPHASDNILDLVFASVPVVETVTLAQPHEYEQHELHKEHELDEVTHIEEHGEEHEEQHEEERADSGEHAHLYNAHPVGPTASDVPSGQASPVSQNSSGYGHSDSSLHNVQIGYGAQRNDGPADIYHLSAKEARERLRGNRRNVRPAMEMSLEEKYRLVSNM